MNLNKVQLIGRLTADPELKTIASGQSVVNVGFATNRNWTDKDGQRQEETEFHNLVVWGKQAEVLSQYLKKGSLAYIEGRLQTRTWQDKDGNNRKTTEVVVERVQFGPRSGGDASFSGGVGSSASAGGPSRKEPSPKEEELPEVSLDDEEEVKSEDVPF